MSAPKISKIPSTDNLTDQPQSQLLTNSPNLEQNEVISLKSPDPNNKITIIPKIEKKQIDKKQKIEQENKTDENLNQQINQELKPELVDPTTATPKLPPFGFNDEEFAKVYFNKIKLNQNISAKNFYAFWFSNLVVWFSTILVELSKIMLLTGKDYFNLSGQEAAKETANILLFERLQSIFTNPLLGILFDRWGRKQVVLLMTAFGVVSIYFMAHLHHIYPYFILCRIGFSIYSTAILTSPIMGDYVRFDCQGKAAGFVQLSTAFGSITASLLASQLIGHLSIKYILTINACGVLVFGFLCGFLLKGGEYFDKKIFKKKEENNIKLYIKKATKQLLNQPWLLVGLCISFLAKIEGFLLASYLVLWVKIFYNANQEDESNQKAASLQFNTFLPLALYAVVLGHCFDLYNKKFLLIQTYVLVIIGTILFILVDNPFSILISVSLVVLGLGQAGLQVIPYFLFNQYTTFENRGVLTGFAGTVSSIGGFFVSYVGTYLFAIVSHLMPMYIYLVLAGLSGLLSGVVYYVKIGRVENQNKEIEENLIAKS